MERNKFMDMVIEQVKEVARPKGMPMTFIKAKDGSLIIGAIALEKKYQTCMALHALKIQTDCEEMIFVQEAWASTTDKNGKTKYQPSKDPKRKECFVVNYFSKDKCLLHMLEFEHTKDKRGLKWTNEANYWDCGNCESRFNPFKFTEENIKNFIQESERDEIKEKGKKEIIKLAMGFHLDIYRKDNKGIMEAYNGKGQCFFATPVSDDDSKFEEAMEDIKTVLARIGGLNDN